MTNKRKIENDKYYSVTKAGRKMYDYGTMCGADVKLLIKGFSYDKELSNYFPNVIIYSRKSTVIWIEEK